MSVKCLKGMDEMSGCVCACAFVCECDCACDCVEGNDDDEFEGWVSEEELAGGTYAYPTTLSSNFKSLSIDFLSCLKQDRCNRKIQRSEGNK